MDGLIGFGTTLVTMLRDVFPIAAVLFGFQALVLRRKIKNPARVAMGMVLVLLGLTLFLEGLELALFPIVAVLGYARLGEWRAGRLKRSIEQ